MIYITAIFFVSAICVFVWLYKQHIGILLDKNASEHLKGHVRQHLYISNFALVNVISNVYLAFHYADDLHLFALCTLFASVIVGGMHFIREFKDRGY